MKRCLIISPFLPFPFSSGGHQAIYNGIACLEDVAEVYFIFSTRESGIKKKEFLEFKRRLPFVKCVPYFLPESRHNLKWFLKCCKNIVSLFWGKNASTPLPITNNTTDDTPPILGVPFLTDHFARFVLSVIKRKRIDLVQAEMMANIRIIDYLPAYVRTVFVHHEIRWVRNELLLRQNNYPPDLLLEVKKAKEEEIGYLNRYDQIIVLSYTDQEKLKSAGVTTSIVSSFAVIDGIFRCPIQTSTHYFLSFIGPSIHFPNYDGIIWFLDNCWSKLLSICPDYQLKIVGEWREEQIEDILSRFKNVTFLGFVDDLGGALNDSILIVPLNIGSGIRMKILEAARFGIPVVSTTIGAEGLPVYDNESILIADTPALFIDAILKLQDEDLRNRIVDSFQRTIKEQFSLKSLRENRKSIYQ